MRRCGASRGTWRCSNAPGIGKFQMAVRRSAPSAAIATQALGAPSGRAHPKSRRAKSLRRSRRSAERAECVSTRSGRAWFDPTTDPHPMILHTHRHMAIPVDLFLRVLRSASSHDRLHSGELMLRVTQNLPVRHPCPRVSVLYITHNQLALSILDFFHRAVPRLPRGGRGVLEAHRGAHHRGRHLPHRRAIPGARGAPPPEQAGALIQIGGGGQIDSI